MRRLKKQNGENRLPFNNGIGDDLRVTLDTVIKIGDLLSAQKNGNKNSGFIPWENWNLPFKEEGDALSDKAAKNLLNMESVSLLNDAYKTLNTYENKSIVQSIEVAVKEITPNPFWDVKSYRMLMSRIKFWAILINEVGVEDYFHCIMAVREHNGKYQAINHHHQLAALRLLQVETVTVPLIHLTDAQMKRYLLFERHTFT